MPRLGIANLKPLAENREPIRAGTKQRPYCRESAMAEDQLRALLLEKSVRAIETCNSKKNRKLAKAVRRLAVRLEYAGEPPETLASAEYCFERFEPVLDHLTKIILERPRERVVMATLLPSNMTIAGDKLLSTTGLDAKRRLRADLDRAGGTTATGFLMAELHGEYHVATDSYDVHYHLIAMGEMIDVVERLRTTRKYTVVPLDEGSSRRGTPPIKLQELNLDHLRYMLSYVLQAWWPARWTGTSADGVTVRGGRNRIPGQRHTEWLLWMDQQRLADLVLLYHLDVRRDGLTVIPPKKVCSNRGPS